MLIISRVCAEFKNHAGEVVYRVNPGDLGLIREAPETIREDVLFNLLVSDGSLEAVESVNRRKVLENDPMLGTDADGKNAGAAAASATKVEGKRKPAKDDPGTDSGKQ